MNEVGQLWVAESQAEELKEQQVLTEVSGFSCTEESSQVEQEGSNMGCGASSQHEDVLLRSSAKVSIQNAKEGNEGFAVEGSTVSVKTPETVTCKSGGEISRESHDKTEKTSDQKILSIYQEIVQGSDCMDWKTLQSNKAVLSNGLLALGIGLSADAFVEDSFKEVDKAITLEIFQKRLKEEREISRKLAWLAQTGVLRCIAKSLTPATDEHDPLSGLKELKNLKDEISKLVRTMQSGIEDCLIQNIKEMQKAFAAAGSKIQNNNKFCVNSLSEMKYIPCVDHSISNLVHSLASR
jgi:hypothetical protein